MTNQKMNYSNLQPLLIYSEIWAPLPSMLPLSLFPSAHTQLLPRKTTPRVRAEMKGVPQTFFSCKGGWEPVQLGASILDSTLRGRRVQEISLPGHREFSSFQSHHRLLLFTIKCTGVLKFLQADCRIMSGASLYCSTKNEITVSPLTGELERLFSEMGPMGHLKNKPSGSHHWQHKTSHHCFQ